MTLHQIVDLVDPMEHDFRLISRSGIHASRRRSTRSTSICSAWPCFFTLAIFLAIVFLALHYRRGGRKIAHGTHGGKFGCWKPLGSSFRSLLTMVMFVWGADVYFDMRMPPTDAIEMQVVGKQWMWKIQHPQGRSEINELHVPIGQPVRLRMISEDVIHSFYIPAFRVKMDVLPERYTSLWFEATKPGEYHLFCAEYCGTDHADMSGRVIVMEPADYAEWLAGGERAAAATAGEKLFTQFRCHTCHYQGGAAARARRLQNLFGRPCAWPTAGPSRPTKPTCANRSSTRRRRSSPAFNRSCRRIEGQLSEEQVFHLIEYIKSLIVAPADTAPAAPARSTPASPNDQS